MTKSLLVVVILLVGSRHHSGNHSHQPRQPQADQAARLSVPFHAQYVAASFGASGDAPVRVVVTLDGAPIPTDRRGGDVLTEPDGQTHLLVDQFRLYDILRNGAESVGELQFTIAEPGLAIYAISLT